MLQPVFIVRPVCISIRWLQPHRLDLRSIGHASVTHNAAHMFNALFESVHRLLKIYQSQRGCTRDFYFPLHAKFLQ